ncbi:MAG TPA: oligosaccharide flippase family protein [Geobacteraceae bacterium]
MSIKRNVIANYASQIYITLIAIVMVPTYLSYMGTEAYGLVGFFSMLQGWLQLMDLGLSATLSREVASYRAGGLTEDRINILLRVLVTVFVGAGLLFATIVCLSSSWISNTWLHANKLPTHLVAQCISLMGAAAAARWIASPYRGVIGGWEKQAWLGVYNIAVNTVRYVLVLAVFVLIGVDPRAFFAYQLLVAVVELVILWWKSGEFLQGARAWPSLALEPLLAMWRFSGSLAFCSIVWIFITQTDKLVLSKTLTLIDYGYFAVAMMVANGVSLLASPISGALLPRLTYLATQQDAVGLQSLYRNATQMVSVVIWPVACTVAFFAEPLLLVWTKNAVVAQHAAPVLFWYALGNACLGVAAFQFYMQFAHGKLRLHVIGNAVFVVVLIPGVLWASIKYGAVGAGRMWFAENLMFFLVWTWIVHQRFAPGLHWKWFGRDVLPIALSALCVSGILSYYVPLSPQRLLVFGQLILFGSIALISAAMSSSTVRGKAALWLNNK